MVVKPGDVFRVPLMWLMQDSHIDLYIIKKKLVVHKEEAKKNKPRIGIDESGYVRSGQGEPLSIGVEDSQNAKMVW